MFALAERKSQRNGDFRHGLCDHAFLLSTFHPGHKPQARMLVGFCDYGMTNIEAKGIGVESIPPPLKFARVSIRETSTH